MINNKHYTYINTTDANQRLVIEAEIDGQRTVFNIDLAPKRVAADILAEVRIIGGYEKNKKIEIKSVTASSIEMSADGAYKAVTKSLGSSAPLSKEEILKRSILMDIETTGLKGGDIIHQVAVYDPTEQKGYMFSPKPQLITQDKLGGEEALSRRGPKRLIGRKIDVGSHKEGKFISTLVEMLKAGEKPVSATAELSQITDDYVKNRISVFELTEKIKPLVERDKTLKSSIQDYLIQTDRFQAVLLADEKKLIDAGIGVDETGKALTPETLTKRKIFEEISTGRASTDDLIDFIHDTTGRSRDELSQKFKGGLVFRHVDSIEKLMTEDLAKVIKGKITWIANASFEAKQFGAQIDAPAEESFQALKEYREAKDLPSLSRKQFFEGFQYGRYERELSALNLEQGRNLLTQNPFYGIIEGVSATSGDPFYTTGKEYNKRRALALKSGDFSGMYKALLEHTQEGDVRDILDMVKAQQSQLINEGIIDQKGPTSLSMEVQGRLFGFTEQMRLAEEAGEILSIDDAIKAMGEAESHMALGDVSITEDRVLKETLDQLEARRLVELGGREGQELLAQAKLGKGAYFRFMTYGHLSNYYNQQARLADGTISKGLDEIGLGKELVKLF